MKSKFLLLLIGLLVLGIVLACGCTSTQTTAPAEPAAVTATTAAPEQTAAATGEKIPVKVFLAGSLTGPFEKLKAKFEEKYPNGSAARTGRER
jgi:molybdate/tungstate transport system substrate-binding protein